ncbi:MULTISPECIES: NmrA family NAD(P)-binding protein [unclassified Streptomyces]|uniref:NAD-dependent epimerase/dehydratase family protein n=1 Tax=unclassified Streptomyces TaxID=2593676 RepID=UPI002DDBE687|nr:NmrA family NAD(P)-binding protein [Streptomyces sp. NBC_01795]WSA90106.1 NmrA family NAD(P)-binding protein [Streptomyces sp. NBC_01795]WSA96892.1 NmrA family NAD(P)-binding protein [Streptomyces sp. NBC_01795]WSS39175.1 NmrA family NAD(P)-binding protein [Streptomyces sp. NBC_01187]WSS46024.1 NmrA family NAD(P)-binding protein [Streptomyces sp. NBC_01187]
MRVLITGATGYVGNAVAVALAEAGHEVFALTRDPGSDRARALRDFGVRPLRGRLADRAVLSGMLAGADAVVHTAFDPDDPVGADRALFGALADAGRRQHLVYTTGCSVYGEHAHAVLTPQTPVDNGNLRARLEAELRSAGLPHTVLRPGMVHGGDARSSIVGDWFRQARSSGPVHRGRRDKVWSWIHVEDLARAYTAVLRAPEEHDGRTYLLADAHPAAPLAVAEAAARAAGSADALAFAPVEDEKPVYRIFDRDEVIDSAAARGALAWTPQESDVLAALPASFRQWSAARP